MRRIFILPFLVFCFYGHSTFAQDTVLTWRFYSPRIIKENNLEFLEFQVQVKCDVPQTFLSSSDVRLMFNINAFVNAATTDLTVYKGDHYNTNNVNGQPEYSIAKNIVGPPNNRRIAFGLTSNGTSGIPPGDDYFQEVLTSFHTMFIVHLKIADPQLLAGIYFRQDLMNGTGTYKKNGTSSAIYYDPHNYEPYDFTSLFLERIYSGASGWSQYGNPGSGQWVDWTTAVKTSVWDSLATPTAGEAMVSKLRVHPDATLFIPPGDGLIVSDTAFLQSTLCLVIRSDETSSGYLLDNNLYMYDTIPITSRYERLMSGERYHDVSVPVSNGTYALLQQQPSPPNQFFRWNEPLNVWENLNDGEDPASPLDIARGYRIKYAGSEPVRNFDGNFSSGPINIPISFTPAPSGGDGWNLIGNPFPSAIFADRPGGNNDFIEQNDSIWGSVYFFDGTASPPNGRSDYSVFNLAGVVRGLENGLVSNGVIAPGQGFFVKAYGANTQVHFDNNMRTGNNGVFFKNQTDPQQILLSLKNSGNDYNEILFCFLPDATTGPDRLLDAPKLKGNPTLAFYSLNNSEDFVIQSNPTLSINDVYALPLGFETAVPGQHVIKLPWFENIPPNLYILLEDLFTGMTINLKDAQEYSFSVASPGVFLTRFILHITPYLSSPDLDESKQYLTVFSKNKTVTFIYTGTEPMDRIILFDITGKELAGIEAHAYKISVDLQHIPHQVMCYSCQTSRSVIRGKFLLE